MILGVAQVVVNVAELEPPGARLLAAGYERTFTEPGIPNNAVKAPLQGAPRTALALEHYAAAPRGTAIELTRYEGAPPAGRAAYELRFPEAPGEQPARVVLAARHVERSVAFWRDGLGFAGEPDALTPRALAPTLRLELAIQDAVPGLGPTTVDADGCVLITLLDTDLDGTVARLDSDGLAVRCCGPWDEQVADRQLRVAVVQGPSGELVELLQAPRPSR